MTFRERKRGGSAMGKRLRQEVPHAQFFNSRQSRLVAPATRVHFSRADNDGARRGSHHPLASEASHNATGNRCGASARGKVRSRARIMLPHPPQNLLLEAIRRCVELRISDSTVVRAGNYPPCNE